MAPIPGILYVTMQPQPDLPLGQFHDWYNNEHGPNRLRLSFCRNGFRYRANDLEGKPGSPEQPEWMAIYDIEDMDYLTQDVYTRLRKAPVQSQRERDTMKQIKVDRRFYDFVREWKSADFPVLDKVENEGEGNVMVSVLFSLKEGEGREDEIKRWYEEEHVGLLQKVPGWRRSRRFVTSYLDLNEGRTKEYLALHEYAPSNGLGGKEFQEATSTEWTKKIYANVVQNRRRRCYDLCYTFGPAPRDLHSLSSPDTIQAASPDDQTRTYPAHVSQTKYPVIESFVTTADGVRLPFSLTGSPDPNAPLLVLVNSILVDYHIWDDFVAHFLPSTNGQYRIVRFNTRGRSSLPPDAHGPITVDTLATDLIAILDALRVRQAAAAIGVSLGGATALNAGLTHPDRIAAFVACDTNAVAPPGNPKAWGERVAVAEREAASHPATGEKMVGAELAEMTVRRWFTPESYASAALSAKIQAVKQMVTENSLAGFKASVQALYAYDFRERMKGFQGKGAFVVGGSDGMLPETMREMAEALGGGAELRVVEGAGHLPMVERPEDVSAFVKEFLGGLR